MTSDPEIGRTRTKIERLLGEVRACTACAPVLPLGPRPVLQLAPSARLLIVGQAPGRKVHETGIPWNDASGERLREWMQVDRAVFHDAERVAILPIGLCYPGAGGSGADKPPRPECAPLWHARLLSALPRIELTLLVGHHAQQYYLGAARKQTMTETVRDFAQYAPRYFPLPHPSWRNVIWTRKHRWFGEQVLPELRRAVRDALRS